jgi:hypothetical protein
MYVKINAKNNTITLCKLIFSNSNKNMLDYNWININSHGFKYSVCQCENVSFCKSNKEVKNKNYNINISNKYKYLFKNID